MSLRDLNKLLEYTEDPELDLEYKANQEWNDRYIKSIDNEYKKYTNIMYHILKNNHVDFYYDENRNLYTIYFTDKIKYDTFMAKEKNSKRFNSCLLLEINDVPFEKLPREYASDKRYINLWIRDGI